jgi:hypothetical protein
VLKFLCDRHFSPHDLQTLDQGAKSLGNCRKRLRPGAVPQDEWLVDGPQLQAEVASDAEMPQLHHFSEDATHAELTLQQHKQQQAAQRRQAAMDRQNRLRASRRIVQRARRCAQAKRCKRRLASYELKLEALKQQLAGMQRLAMEANESREQFERLLTDRGRELLQQPIRGIRGAYSEHLRIFVSQLHFCSPKGYSHLRRFFRLPAASTIRMWNQVDCRPGITAQSMQKIKELAAISEQFKDWVLSIDAMHIRSMHIILFMGQ